MKYIKNLFLILAGIILGLAVPWFIDRLYYAGFKSNISANTTFASGEVLEYYGAILSGIITVVILYISLKAQRDIFRLEINSEKINRKIEKRSYLSIDEQFLIGYKLDKYKFKNTSIIYINDSYRFVRDNDIKINVSLENGKEDKVNCLDHMEYRYLVISNVGEHPLLSLNIKIKACFNDENNRTLEIEQDINQSTLVVGGSLYVMVSGILEILQFVTLHNLERIDEVENIKVYIPSVEIKCLTVAGETLTIKKDREAIEKNEYVTEMKSDIVNEVIKCSTYEHEIQYIGCSASKSKKNRKNCYCLYA